MSYLCLISSGEASPQTYKFLHYFILNDLFCFFSLPSSSIGSLSFSLFFFLFTPTFSLSLCFHCAVGILGLTGGLFVRRGSFETAHLAVDPFAARSLGTRGLFARQCLAHVARRPPSCPLILLQLLRTSPRP